MNDASAVTKDQNQGSALKNRWPWVVAGLLVVWLTGSALAYRRWSAGAPAAAAVRDVPHLDGKWIRYSPAFAKRSKIEFAPCTEGRLSPVVSVTGTVAFDPELVAAVGSRIEGRVRRIAKFPGDEVNAGEVIAELESADLGNAQAAVLAARAHADAAMANEKREVELADARVSSQRDAELARAAASMAKADLVAAEQRVRALGGSASGEIGVLLLKAPIDGKVVELHISRGQSVSPTFTAARVADLRRVWIDLAVFEREIGHIRPHDHVEISPQTNLALIVPGRVAHVGDVIDRDTRSAPVRIVVENKDGSLRPGQSVLAKIHTASTTHKTLMIPLDALTSIDGNPTVFVMHDDTSVEPRTIALGPRDAVHALVVSGLQPDDRIVISGVFALKSEVFR